MLDFAKNEIKSFWDWIEEHKEYVTVQYNDEENFFLYIALEHEIIEEFISRYQYNCEEGGCDALMQTNSICFDLADIEGGYGFSMKDLWDNRPAGIEDSLGIWF